MHLGSTGQLLYTEVIQSLMPLEQVVMSMKPLNFLWHIQMTIYLMLWSYQEWETSGSHQWLKSQHSSGVRFCFLPRSNSRGWAPDLFRGELLVHLCAVPKGTVPLRNRLQVIHTALEVSESPCSHIFVFIRSGTNSVQCLLKVHRWMSSPEELWTRSELPGLYFELPQPKDNFGKPHPKASWGGRDKSRTGGLSVLLQETE